MQGLTESELIQKETIRNFKFNGTNDVLYFPADKDRRQKDLAKAMILGNSYKKKVRITFETTEGQKLVETTVWATTEKNVLLKGGLFIPVSCIKEVAFPY